MYYKHGQTNTRLYSIWQGMIQRCHNRSNTRYTDYGGRGIRVCEQWLDFSAFSRWAIRAGYNDTLTLDREDNSGNYTPFNCRWVTPTEQQNNTRRNRHVTFNGEDHTIAEWAKITGIKANTIITRLNRGWSVEDSLTIPIGGKYGRIKKTL